MRFKHKCTVGGFRKMEDDQIKAGILDVLKGTAYELLHFERDHVHFGNMIARIKTGKREYCFVSDRDDIFCDDKLIFLHGYHIVGEDDTPTYFIKAIEQLVR